MIILRDYQTSIIDSARSMMLAGKRSILICSPTGSGKTALTAQMLATAASKNMRSWFVVHRRELIKQSIRAFADIGIKAGVVSSGFEESPGLQIQICSIQTLARRITNFTKPDLIVWDEAHHLAAGSWAKIYESIPQAYHIGLTATPERLDGTGLSLWFNDMVLGPSVSWLIQNKFLSPYKLYAPQGLNISGIATRMGDYHKTQLALAVDKPTITGDAISHYKMLADGKRAVVFCVSVEHSKHVVEQFKQAGIPAAHVDGETDSEQRDNAIRMFAEGTYRVLSNVELFGEGFDIPSIECGILLRPTQSLGLYLQQVGRVLRPSPGKKEAIILDHAGNCHRHGLPDDVREWSLHGMRRDKKSSDRGVSVKVCQKCFAAQKSGASSCRFCDFSFPVDSRIVAEVEGTLEQMTAETLRREKIREQAKAVSLDDLINLGRQRGYRRPDLWARHVFMARRGRR